MADSCGVEFLEVSVDDLHVFIDHLLDLIKDGINVGPRFDLREPRCLQGASFPLPLTLGWGVLLPLHKGFTLTEAIYISIRPPHLLLCSDGVGFLLEEGGEVRVLGPDEIRDIRPIPQGCPNPLHLLNNPLQRHRCLHTQCSKKTVPDLVVNMTHLQILAFEILDKTVSKLFHFHFLCVQLLGPLDFFHLAGLCVG